MKIFIRLVFSLLLTCSFFKQAKSQTEYGDTTEVVSARMLGQMERRTSSINKHINLKTNHYLKRLTKREVDLRDELFRIDSATAKRLFDDTPNRYDQLALGIDGLLGERSSKLEGKYIPYLDSLQGSLNFLKEHKDFLESNNLSSSKLQTSIEQVKQLQHRFAKTESIEDYVAQRKQLITETISKYASISTRLSKTYTAYSKDAYYYSAQLKEYKAMLKNPSILERKALNAMRKLPAYQQFMKENSLLAGLFNVPANYGTSEALAGLQTRAQVQQILNTNLSSLAGNSGIAATQQLQSAQVQLTQLKANLDKLNGETDQPSARNFKPNNEKTKTFRQRLEYGSNFQTTKGTTFFPATSDIGLSIGYKLNAKSTVGIGGSYKLGLGKDIRHISFTHQGIGLRSFLEYKLKGSFWVTGGAEMNYRNRFTRLSHLKDHSAWQESALIGITKKYQISKKIKGNAQLLFDALSQRQVPRGQPLIFRVGYHLK